jgi:hypothetical protein
MRIYVLERRRKVNDFKLLYKRGGEEKEKVFYTLNYVSTKSMERGKARKETRRY